MEMKMNRKQRRTIFNKKGNKNVSRTLAKFNN